MSGAKPAGTLVIKGKGRLWPTVTWRGSQLIVYYIGEGDEDINIEETREIDFEELLLRLDGGDSVFITMKPRDEAKPTDTEAEEWCRWC